MFPKNLMTRWSVYLLMVVSFVSCGKSSTQFIKDVKVESYAQGADIYISMNASLNLGAMSLPTLSLPVNHPRTGENLGQIEMGAISGGSNLLKLAFNLSAVTTLSAGAGQLPNGGLLPLIGLNQVVEIPVGGSAGVKLYISFVNGAYALGVAVPIRSFDGIGATVGTTSLFPVFNIANVIGSAGLFTSQSAGGNGFGIFVDLTQVLNDVFKNELQARSSHMVAGAKSAMKIKSVEVMSELNYNSIEVSSSQKKKIDNEIYKLHKKKTRLKLH